MSFLAYPVTDQQKKMIAIADELADIFAKRAPGYDWEGQFPLENYEDLRRSGYLTLTVPRDLGGWGASLLDIALAQEHLGRGCASTALAVSMHLINIARLAGSLAGPSEVFTNLCHAVVQEGAMINMAASEPVTGSPSRGGRPTTTARRQPNGSWCITGRKTYTTGSLALHYFIVSCSIEDEAPDLAPLQTDRGNFLIPRNIPGLSIETTWNSLAMRASGSNDLVLDNICLDGNAYIDISIPTMPNTRELINSAWTLATTAVYLGIAQAACDEAIKFAQHRQPNSLKKPIANLPHIQEKAGRMQLALLQSQAVLFGIIEQFSSHPESVHKSQFGAAKYIVTNKAVEVVDLAMRLVGAASLSLNSPLQRYYRDVRAGLHNPPMEDLVISQLGREALEV